MPEGTFDRLRANAAGFRPEAQPLAREVPEGAGKATSLIEGASITNDFTIGDRALQEVTRERGEFDPAFRPGTWLRDNKEYSWLLEMAAQDDDLFENLHSSRNAEDLQAIGDLQQERIEQWAAAAENPISAITGGLAGIALSPSTYLPVVGLKGAQVLGILSKVAKNARMVGASRLAIGEATVQAGVEAVAGVSDPSAGTEEIITGAVLGAVGGGIAGALAPRAAALEIAPLARNAKFDRASAAQRATAAADDDVVPGAPGRAVGAAEPDLAPGLDTPNPTTSGSLGRTVFGAEFYRSSKQRAQNWSAKFSTAPKATQTAVGRYTDLLGKFVRWDQPTLGEEIGQSARKMSVEEFKEVGIRQALKGPMDAVIRGAWGKFRDKHGLNWGFHPINRGEDSIRPRWVGAIPKPQITRGEFDYFQAKMMRLMEGGAEADDAGKTVIKQSMGTDVDLEMSQDLLDSLKEAVTARTSFFDNLREQAIEAGLDEDGLLAAGRGRPYFPQVYDTSKVLAREEEVIEAMMENMRWDPPQEWLNAIADSPAAVNFEGLTKGADFQKLPATTKEDLRDILTGELSLKAQGKIDARVTKAEKALGVKKDEGTQVVMSRHNARISEQQVKITETKKQLADKVAGKKNLPSQRAILGKLAKQEERLNGLVDKRDIARRAMLEHDQWEELLKDARRTASRKEVRTIDRILKDVEKAQGTVEKTTAKAAVPVVIPDLQELATKMVKNINGALNRNETAFGFSMGEPGRVGKSGRLHPRQINWGTSLRRGDGLLDDILVNDPEQITESYIEQVGTRIGMNKALGTTDPEALIKEITDELPTEIRAQAINDLNAVMDRSLGRHHLKGMGQYDGVRWGAQLLKNVNVVGMLGSSALSLAGDLGMTSLSREVAKGNLGFTAKSLFGLTRVDKAGRVRTLTDNLIKMEKNTLAALVMGSRNLANVSTRQARLADIDALANNRGVGVPGSAIWKMTRMATAASKVASDTMMNVNLMNHWNLRWDHALRRAHIANIWDIGKKGWDEAPENVQAAMRSAGLTPKKLERITKLYDETQFTVDDVTLPDIDNWPKDAQLDMIRWVETRSMNGIIAPGVGDMPNFANDPLGSLLFQFQGFPFSAQQKMARRARQKGLGDPLVQQAIYMAFIAGGISQVGRHVTQGNLDKLPTDDVKLAQFIYDVALRSPFSVAGTGMWSELGINASGRPANNILRQLGIPEIVPQNSRLRERQALAILLGPGASTVNNLATNITGAAADAAEGEFGEAGGKLARRAPFSSHFLIRALDGWLGDD